MIEFNMDLISCLFCDEFYDCCMLCLSLCKLERICGSDR